MGLILLGAIIATMLSAFLLVVFSFKAFMFALAKLDEQNESVWVVILRFVKGLVLW